MAVDASDLGDRTISGVLEPHDRTGPDEVPLIAVGTEDAEHASDCDAEQRLAKAMNLFH